MENANNATQEQNIITGDEKSVDNITLDQFKSALENNIECKGYFDSLCDKTVNTRLDKGIESWKEKNLQSIIESEINKRYPQKTEAEIKFENQQKELEKFQEEKRQLELKIKYHDLMAENNLPIDILDFVTGKDLESTIDNIGRFKKMVESMVKTKADKIVQSKLSQGCYVPPSDSRRLNSDSMWDV